MRNEIAIIATPQPDRLPPMLLLASLLYAVVLLGVTFEYDLELGDDATSLEVTIVAETDQNVAPPEDADYLAQASQEGGGNTVEHVRPAAALESLAPDAPPAELLGDVAPQTAPGEAAPEHVLTAARETATAIALDSSENPAPEAREATSPPEGLTETLPLPTDEQPELLIRDDDPRHLVISADTRESRIAPYLDAWKRKVERVGTVHYPEVLRASGLRGSPTLEVAIDARGDLTDIVMLRSSGHRLLDQAAFDILRRAAPFDPFPETLSRDYDELRFAYKWQFDQGGSASAVTLGRR